MLSCEETKNLLSAYYDGELGVAAANEVAQHLASCEECKKIYDDMSFLSGAFAGITYPEIDEKFTQSLGEKLSGVSKNMHPKGFGVCLSKMRPYIAAAACFVLIVGAYVSFNNGYVNNAKYTEPTPLTVQTNELQKDVVGEADVEQNQQSADIKEDAVKNQNTARVHVRETEKPANEYAAENNNGQDENGKTSAVREVRQDTIINSRTITPEEITLYLEDEASEQMIEPLEEDVLALEDADVYDKETDEGPTQKNTNAQFVLLDKTQIDALKDIVYNYGTCQTDETHIYLTLLLANYNACIDVLSGLEWIEALEVQIDTDSEYCYITINI